MKRVYWTAAFAAAVLAIPAQARADVTLVEKDGWTFYTKGLVAAHYQLIKGDADPTFSNGVMSGVPSAGGQILDERTSSDQRDNSLTLSNIRSGFIGTQIGFGVNRKISDSVRVESLLAINAMGITATAARTFRKTSTIARLGRRSSLRTAASSLAACSASSAKARPK